MRSIEKRLEELEGRGPREVPELTEERFEEIFERHFPMSVKMPSMTPEEGSEEYLTSTFESFRQPGGILFRKGEH